MGEYYIREPDSEDTRGPFDPGRIADLMEAGKVSESTLYYDEDREDWLPLLECAEIHEAIYPSQKPLELRAREQAEALNHDDEDLPEVKVDEMLAAAEGNTHETRHLRARQRQSEAAAGLSLPVLAVIMLLAAINDIWPSAEVINLIRSEGEWGLLVSHPLLIVGVGDLFLTLCCILSVTDAFPLIRFRMMLGLGYFSYIYWAWGDTTQMFAVAAGSIAAWICTVTLNLKMMILCAVVGIFGMGIVAVHTVLS